MKNNTTIRWTLLRAAEEFGVSRETIRRGLRTAGIDESKTYTTREIFRAIGGDFNFERTRRERAEADAKERENKLSERQLITIDEAMEAEKLSLTPARQRFIALPAEMASRCNPTDPEFARAALEQWRDEALKVCREQLMKTNGE